MSADASLYMRILGIPNKFLLLEGSKDLAECIMRDKNNKEYIKQHIIDSNQVDRVKQVYLTLKEKNEKEGDLSYDEYITKRKQVNTNWSNKSV